MSNDATISALASVLDVAVVGTGFSGICMGVQLKRAGIESFVLLEKAGDVGGTWRENTYPGAACDIPSHLYSFSFEPNPTWTRAYSPQAEIFAYLRRTADKYSLREKILFHAEVIESAFDETAGIWTVRLKDGRSVRARSLVLGNGALHIPAYPDIAGRTSFRGASFHSACWDHGYDLTGKNVAVIGTGASSIQFVPQIAPKVGRLFLYQRTPPWIIPKLDRPMTERERQRFADHPWVEKLYRAAIYWRQESQVLGFTVDQRILKLGERIALNHLRRTVKDPAKVARLTPSYRMGCKRILLSNDYYPALNRPNVELVTERIETITPEGVRTADGIERHVDAIVYGTGFNVSEYLAPIRIVGAEGRDINTVWRETPEAYLGITIAGFPNLYLLMGPNTGLGHNSMIFMIEAQAHYAIQCIQALRSRKLISLDVRRDVQTTFNREIQEKLRHTVWASGCKSWYQSDDGRNSTLWPGATWKYWLQTRRMRLGDYSAREAQ